LAQDRVITTADLSEAFLNNVAITTLEFCMPLYWHDRTLGWPKPVTGASCLLVFKMYLSHLAFDIGDRRIDGDARQVGPVIRAGSGGEGADVNGEQHF
jgi:hypothetical protein